MIHIDSKIQEFWQAGSPDQLSYGMPATGFNSYPEDYYFDRCGALYTDMGLLGIDGYDRPETSTDIVSNDMWAYDIDAHHGPVVRAGPIIFNRLTLDTVGLIASSVDNSNGLHNYRNRQTYNNFVMNDVGHDDGGAIGYTAGDKATYMNDGYIYGFVGSTFWSVNQPTLSNVDQVTDPIPLGLQHPGRIERGSTLKADGDGADNFYLTYGAAGSYYDDDDVTIETNEEWLPRLCFELVAPFLADYDYTGPTKTLGEQTLLGDRGCVSSGENLNDYITSAMGNTPIPNASVYKVGSDLFVS